WQDLRNQVAAGLGLSMAGVPNWTFDIGGYVVEDRYLHPSDADLAEWREIYTRWFQFGAFVPVFRSHGQGQLREIYNVAPPGSEVYETLARYDRLRYRLMPYIYTLASETYRDDYTMMRGLVMDFPSDPNVSNLADEYMFGPAFLVAPVGEYKARSREVYLPAGARWYDFHTGRRFEGRRKVAADAPLSRMPLFVRAGSIVPVGPAIEYTGEKPAAPVTLFVYTGANGRFELYGDDGESYAYQTGGFARIPIIYDDAHRTLTIGVRQGSFKGMVKNRVFNIRWISGPGTADLDAKPDKRVVYSGAAIVVRRP
ncbi:MAG TPA: TIM-barrel domain-containing protein, partial [Rhizomicrobium sp.]|nr:TIM-barrel domain-containing protein [Rhizomicrobium sp.]